MRKLFVLLSFVLSQHGLNCLCSRHTCSSGGDRSSGCHRRGCPALDVTQVKIAYVGISTVYLTRRRIKLVLPPRQPAGHHRREVCESTQR